MVAGELPLLFSIHFSLEIIGGASVERVHMLVFSVVFSFVWSRKYIPQVSTLLSGSPIKFVIFK